MSLHASPGVDHGRLRRAVVWFAAALVAVTVLAGCGVLGAWVGLPYVGGGYSDFSDYPDPCTSVNPTLSSQYAHGEATVVLTRGVTKTLTLPLVRGQFMPVGAAADPTCMGGTDVSFQDGGTNAAWMLEISLPDAGVATPSAPRVEVFLMHQAGMNATGIAVPRCTASLTSLDATLLSGTVSCAGVSWTEMTPGALASPSGSTFDMAITFTATP